MNDYNNLYSTPTNTPSENTNDVADEFVENIAPVLKEDDEVINLGEDFDFDGFQVVRREFFCTHKRTILYF